MKKIKLLARYGRNLILPVMAGIYTTEPGDTKLSKQKINDASCAGQNSSAELKLNYNNERIKFTLAELRKNFEMLQLLPLTTSCDGKLLPPPTRSSQRILGRNFVADAVELALPSVVRIHVESSDAMDSGMGSGFVIDSKEVSDEHGFNGEAIIITNAHVVLSPNEFQSQRRNQDNKSTLYESSMQRKRCVLVETQSGRRLLGQVAAVDVETDLAIVQIVKQNNNDHRHEGIRIPMAQLGKSESLRHGEFVVSVGAPLCLENSVTAGIVSNPRRFVPKSGSQLYFIQTDTAINTGNSGGPLVNLDGQVVGINTLKHPGAEGIGYAIPIDTARSILRQLLTSGKVIRPKLGFKLRATALTIESEMDLDNTLRSINSDNYMANCDENDSQLLTSLARVSSANLQIMQQNYLLDVVSIEKNSAAYSAGLRPGDTVLELNDMPVYKSEQIQHAVAYNPDVILKLKIKRKGKERDAYETLIIEIKPTLT